MNGRFFLDTNVFVYSFDPNSPKKAKIADELIAEAIATGKGLVSFQVVEEFFNVAFRRFQKPMSLVDADIYLSAIFRPILGVHSSEILFRDALQLRHRYQLSWYDALLVRSAIAGGCEVLYTEDLQDAQKFGSLKVVNPFK